MHNFLVEQIINVKKIQKNKRRKEEIAYPSNPALLLNCFFFIYQSMGKKIKWEIEEKGKRKGNNIHIPTFPSYSIEFCILIKQNNIKMMGKKLTKGIGEGGKRKKKENGEEAKQVYSKKCRKYLYVH